LYAIDPILFVRFTGFERGGKAAGFWLLPVQEWSPRWEFCFFCGGR